MSELTKKDGSPFTAPHPVQHPHNMKCGLCGQSYAVMNSTWHISSAYRIYFCRECTDIMLKVKDRIKVAIRGGAK